MTSQTHATIWKAWLGGFLTGVAVSLAIYGLCSIPKSLDRMQVIYEQQQDIATMKIAIASWQSLAEQRAKRQVVCEAGR